MTESKHTPGPCSTKIECQHAKDLYYGDHLDWQDFIVYLCPNCFHRARLIAAVPKLLAAINLYLADCELELLEYNDDTYNAARAAIAEAEGK